MTTAGLDLLVVGDCNPDVLVVGDDVTPDFGQREKLVGSISLVVGGSAAITAVAAARLGLRVGLAAAIGTDAAGDFMLGRLAAEGVTTAAVVRRPDLATGLTVVLSDSTDRAILTATGAMTSLTAADVSPGLLRGVRHVHVSSYFLLEHSLGPGLAALLARARSGGARTSLDTNWDPAGRWGGSQLRDVLAQTALLLPNEEEARRLSGQQSLEAAVAELTGRGPSVVVKLGAAGALCAGRSGLREVDAPELAGPVVDTTGAGDCFNAGLITGLLQGRDLPGATRLGCAAGSASVRGAGGTAAAPSLAAALALAGLPGPPGPPLSGPVSGRSAGSHR